MSYQRVENVLHHGPDTLTATERLALVVLAERAPGTDPSRVVRYATDDLARILRCQAGSVRKVFLRLAEAGIETRVAVGEIKKEGATRAGQPMYAHRGQLPMYRVPWFPPPPGCRCPACFKGARHASGGDQDGGSHVAPSVAEGVPPVPPSTPNGGTQDPPSTTEGGSQDPPNSEEGGTVDPPNDGKAGQEERKGGTGDPPYPYPEQTTEQTRGAHEPEPAPVAQPAAAEEVRESKPTTTEPPAPSVRQPWVPHRTEPEAIRIVAEVLAEAVPPATEAEVREAHTRWRKNASPQRMGLYRLVRSQGGIPWLAMLDEIRAEEIGAKIDKLRTDGEDCPHRDPGGAELHPVTGQALCPLCRRGVPAQSSALPTPAETYLRLYTAHHGEAPAQPLMAAVADAFQRLAAKHPAHRLSALAAEAAEAGVDIVTHLQNAKEQARA